MHVPSLTSVAWSKLFCLMNLFPFSPKMITPGPLSSQVCSEAQRRGGAGQHFEVCNENSIPSFLPEREKERGRQRVWGIIITTNLSSIAMPWIIFRHPEKGKTFVFCFTRNFLHTDLVAGRGGGGGGSQFSVNGVLIFPIIFRKKQMQYTLSSACLRWGANAMPCNQVAGRRSCALLPREACGRDKFQTYTLVGFKPPGAEPEAQEVWSKCLAPGFVPNSGATLSWGQFLPSLSWEEGPLRVNSWKPKLLKTPFA